MDKNQIEKVLVGEVMRLSAAINVRNQRVAGLETEIERLLKARECADEASALEIKSLRAALRQSEHSRRAVVSAYGKFVKLADDAVRALYNDDRDRALSCLRDAFSDVLNDIESVVDVAERKAAG